MEYFKEIINELICKNDILSLGKKNKLYVLIETYYFILKIIYCEETNAYIITKEKMRTYLEQPKQTIFRTVYIKNEGIIDIINIIMSNFKYPSDSSISVVVKDCNNLELPIKQIFLKNYNIFRHTSMNLPLEFFEKTFNNVIIKAINLIKNVIDYDL